MFKSNEFKAYGSIRKTKVAGTCGVILALAMMAMVTNGNVFADEVKPSTPATTEVAKPASSTEAPKKETKPASPTEAPKTEAKADSKAEAKKEETVKPVESADLDSTVKKAKEAGIKVTEKEKSWL